jgi:hypothetical protein
MAKEKKQAKSESKKKKVLHRKTFLTFKVNTKIRIFGLLILYYFSEKRKIKMKQSQNVIWRLKMI